jgi:hypothetical protein
MSAATASRPCPQCGIRPCRPGQRLCGLCHLAYKRQRRAEERVSRETLSGTPEETAPALETGGNGMEKTPVRVVPAPSAPLLKRRRPGPQVPADWPARFLKFYARHGVRWRGAKYAGISYDTLVRAEQADLTFAQQVENARQTYLDRHALNMNRLAFKKDNVVASIVALKAGRPMEYVEKNMSITASFTTELPPADGKALLQAMLGQPGASAISVLEPGQVQPTTEMRERGLGADAD